MANEDNANAHTSLKYFRLKAAKFIRSAELVNKITERLTHMLTQQDISLRDVQRLLTCLALFPRTFDTLAYGSKSIVVGAALLKVLHPAVYAKLRDERLSLEEVSAALSLHQPRDPANRSPEHSDWCIWAIALVGTKAREYDQVPSLFFDRLIRSFGEYGEEFSWHDTRRRLADMFDSFTLPPS